MNEYKVHNFNENSKIEFWKQNRKLHREDDLPAIIFYDESGNKVYENWYIKGNLHRNNDKPSMIYYYENGNIKEEFWYFNFVDEIVIENNSTNNNINHHRVNNPAYINYDLNGNIIKKHYYLFNKQISEDNFLKLNYIFKRKIWRFKNKNRKKLNFILKQTSISKLNGKDISNLISTFIY